MLRTRGPSARRPVRLGIRAFGCLGLTVLMFALYTGSAYAVNLTQLSTKTFSNTKQTSTDANSGYTCDSNNGIGQVGGCGGSSTTNTPTTTKTTTTKTVTTDTTPTVTNTPTSTNTVTTSTDPTPTPTINWVTDPTPTSSTPTSSTPTSS